MRHRRLGTAWLAPRTRLLGATALALTLAALTDPPAALANCGPLPAGNSNDEIVCDAGAPNPFVGDVDALAGDDTITINAGTVDGSIRGNEGHDSIVLTDGRVSIIEGNDGADTIVLAGGDVGSTTFAGEGDDVIVLSGASTGLLNAGEGGDTLTLTGGAASAINGNLGNDRITLDGAIVAGEVEGAAGEDTISLLSGQAAQLRGGTNDDLITVEDGTVDFITGDGGGAPDIEPGADTIILFGGVVGGNVVGDDGNDLITLAGGSVGGDLAGGHGDDTITIDAGTVDGLVYGHDGHDSIILNAGRIGGIDGAEGADTIVLAGGSIVGAWSAGADDDLIILSGTTNDTGSIGGGEGNDTFVLTAGLALAIFAHEGDDLIMLDGASVTSHDAGEIGGGSGVDTIRLLSGQANRVEGGLHGDVITLDGATVDAIIGDGQFVVDVPPGADTITLIAGLVREEIIADHGDDLILLAGGTVGGRVLAWLDNDTITLTGSTVGGDLDAGPGHDSIRLLGGSLGGDLLGDDGNDTIRLSGGSMGGAVLAGAGHDSIQVDAGFLLTQLDAGDGDDAVVNFGTLTGGQVALGDGNDTFHNETGGVFTATGTSDFGAGTDLFRNEAGALFRLGGSGVQSVTLAGLEGFRNAGTIALEDGATGDSLSFGGVYEGAGGALAIDTFLNSGLTDITDSIRIAGNSIGTTTAVDVNVTNDSLLGLGFLTGHGPNAGIRIVDVQGATSTGDFVLAHPVETLLFSYDLTQANGQDWFLQSDLHLGLLSTPNLLSSTQATMQASNDALGLRLAALRHDGSDALQPQAMALGLVEADAGVPDGARAWMTDIDAGAGQELNGFQFGADYEFANAGGHGNTLILGMTAGELGADADFDGANAFAEGSVIGGYATWLAASGFFINTALQVQTLEASYQSATATLGSIETDTRLTAIGSSVEAGYTFRLGEASWIEPLAGVSYVTVGADQTLDWQGVPVALQDGGSLLGRLGVSAGTELTFGRETTAAPYVRAEVLNEFLGENQATVAGYTVTDDTGGASLRLGGGVAIAETGGGFTAFADADVTVGAVDEGVNAKVGVRWSW